MEEKLYPVESCSSFRLFAQRMKDRYGPRTAFCDYENSWTYDQLYEIIRRAAPQFAEGSARYYYLNIEHPFWFCAALFAVVVGGKIALLSPAEPEEGGVEEVREIDLMSMQIGGPLPPFPPECASEKPAVVAKSSGTTLTSKAILLSQRNLLSDTIGGMRRYEYPEGAVYYQLLPCAHLFGVVADLLGPLYSGGTICFSGQRLNFFKDIRYFQPTNMNLPPAMVYMLEKMIDTTGNPEWVTGGRLRKIMCAGAAVKETTITHLREAGISVFPAYGLTECSPCVSMNSELAFRPGSVGKVLPCCEVSIRDGEVAVRGDSVMLGYLDDQEATAKTIREGWLYTGDMGYLDGDGFLFLTGRKSNLIVFEDGTKVVPEELEQEISALPGVSECLLTEKRQDVRLRIRLTVVPEALTDWDALERKIRTCFERRGLSSRLETVILTTEKLPRNKLGKIIRHPLERSTG